MRLGRTLLALFAAISLAAHAADDSGLDRTLDRLARVAELYRDTALGFTCRESISYTAHESGHIEFAYLLIRDDTGKLRDFRTWSTGTTAKARAKEVDPSDYHVPRFLESAYLWVFIFRSDRQPLYRFHVVGDEVVGGRNAVKIAFVPRNPVRKGLNDWVGFASVDRETSQMLEVEAYTPGDWNRKVRRDIDIASAPSRSRHADRQTYDIERIVTEFGFEKNGMRFPSHVEIKKFRSTVVPGKVAETTWDTTLRKVTQDYSRFEFFSVRSSEEILRFVNGEWPLAPQPAADAVK